VALSGCGGELEGSLFHLGGHEGEGIGAGGGEVLLEAGLVDKGHIGGEDVFGGLPIEDADKEGNHALGDEGVGIGNVAHAALVAGGIEPHLGLAAFDEFVGGLKLRGHRRQLFSESNDILVALGPILEEGESVEEFLLGVGDGGHGGKVTRGSADGKRKNAQISGWREWHEFMSPHRSGRASPSVSEPLDLTRRLDSARRAVPLRPLKLAPFTLTRSPRSHSISERNSANLKHRVRTRLSETMLGEYVLGRLV
jgi:hypothetical protein